METVSARFFDGKTSKPTDMRLTCLPNGNLALLMTSAPREFTLKQVTLGQHITGTPYQIIIASGGIIEIAPSPEADRFIAYAFPQGSRVPEHLERNMKRSLFVMAMSFVTFAALLYYGIPLVSQAIYPWIPLSVKERAGNNTIKLLDTLLFSRSSIGTDRQNTLRALAAPLLRSAFPDSKISIEFRGAHSQMANAMAIFPRTIICTDQLVSLLTPEEIQAVLAHEIGHLKLDHGTRQLINQTAIQILPAITMGSGVQDSYMLKMVIQKVLPSSFSRDQEREADAFAVDILRRQLLEPRHLISALEKLHAYYRTRQSDTDEMIGKIERIFASHPDLEERRDAILRSAGYS